MADDLKHYGMPFRSGRYPWGSGENPRASLGKGGKRKKKSKDDLPGGKRKTPTEDTPRVSKNSKSLPDPLQKHVNFKKRFDELKSKTINGKKLTNTQIARDMEMKTKEMIARNSLAKAAIWKANSELAQKYKENNLSNVQIGLKMGVSDKTVALWLDPAASARMQKTMAAENMLKSEIAKNKYIDVGGGSEIYLGISYDKLNTVVESLKAQGGYIVVSYKIPQMGTGKETTVRTAFEDDGRPFKEQYRDLMLNKHLVRPPVVFSQDKGATYKEAVPPRSIDSSRVEIRYPKDGGNLKDGVIEIRRGVPELSLGANNYIQVRIAVDGTHYLKGMAVYSDKMPPGVDVIFNTAKPDSIPKMSLEKHNTVLKIMNQKDPVNPFGATIKQDQDKLKNFQIYYKDSNGKEQLSAINVVNEEGDWADWSKTISSQVLSKQSPALAKRLLADRYDFKKMDYDETMSLQNPVVKKILLDSLATDFDSEAVNLKAAAMAGMASHVLLPFPNMKENEIYAPNYIDGTTVALIRYPHGGQFEIPSLVVNNKYGPAKALIRKGKDAVGVHPKQLLKMSGADCDGDSVLVIPNNEGEIKTKAAFKSLLDFDPIVEYPRTESTGKPFTNTQREMGIVTNLIQDMTIRHAPITDASTPTAPLSEIVRAVRHSMVTIDAEKNDLDFKRSYKENGIEELKKKYQDGGASTLITRAGAELRVDRRVEGKYVWDEKAGREIRRYVDPKTGEKLYTTTGGEYVKYEKYAKDTVVVNKDGTKTLFKAGDNKLGRDGLPKSEIVKKTTATTPMAEAKDAYDLISKDGGTVMERVYADHANKFKALANQARLESLNIETIPQSKSAKEVYAKERDSLLASLRIAESNRPFERSAHALANKLYLDKYKQLKEEGTIMTKAQKKKERGRCLIEARYRLGAKKTPISINDREWEAIQSGAISTNILRKILRNTDIDVVKQRAMPRTTKGMSAAKVARARSMLANPLNTQAMVAEALGVSVTTLMNNVE